MEILNTSLYRASQAHLQVDKSGLAATIYHISRFILQAPCPLLLFFPHRPAPHPLLLLPFVSGPQ